MAVLFLSEIVDPKDWVEALKAVDPSIEIRIWPDEVGDPAEIDYALVTEPPRGELAKYPNLKGIFSMWAGMDHILRDADALPQGVPVMRMVDPTLTTGVAEYCVAETLRLHFNNGQPYPAGDTSQWQRNRPIAADRHVGIMGLGEIGGLAARHLKNLGFQVAGWSRSPKDIDGVASFAGAEQLTGFLARSEILISLLPSTSETRNLVDKDFLMKLPRGACFINAGRGDQVVENDLIDAIDEGHIAAAALDVFRREPLPDDHPFWSHPRIRVTPHIAGNTRPSTAAPVILDNMRRIESGEGPRHVVDPKRGY